MFDTVRFNRKMSNITTSSAAADVQLRWSFSAEGFSTQPFKTGGTPAVSTTECTYLVKFILYIKPSWMVKHTKNLQYAVCMFNMFPIFLPESSSRVWNLRAEIWYPNGGHARKGCFWPSWWFQPIWKICSSKWLIHLPQFLNRGEN